MTYTIADEPVETSLRDFVVRPSAPLLAAMMCGSWLAWPWFAFNAIAIGSPTRRREVAMCAAAFAVTTAVAVTVFALFRYGIIPNDTVLRLALLAISTCKLAFSYKLSAMQERTFHVYEYYGGSVRNPQRVLAIGWIAKRFVFALIDHPLWHIIVSGGL